MLWKKIVAPALVLAGAAGIVAVVTQTDAPTQKVADYAPRAPQEPSREPNGAFEIQKRLLGDITTGEINSQGLLALRAEAERLIARDVARGGRAVDHYWNELGPDNIGGRIRAIFAVTENQLYTGGVSGGLWRSPNGGDQWYQVHGFPNMMIGSIAVTTTGVIYVGTGSMFDGGNGDGGSGFRGRGIYYSTDNGASFQMVEGTDPGYLGGGDFTATDALVVDPTNGNRVWFASNGGYGSIENGVMDLEPANLPAGAKSDIAVAQDGSYMLVAMANGRVYRSNGSDYTDFTLLSGPSSQAGALPQSGIGRCRVDISMDDPNHAFALYATSGGFFYGLYHSENAGQSWSGVWPGGLDQATPLPRGQGIYDLALGIAKGQPDLAYVGGIELWRSGPNQQAELAALPFHFGGTNFDVHADVHEIIFTPGGKMYVATDGGIYRSMDGGATYVDCNRDLAITQFYGMDHSSHSAVLGGTQDNGSLLIPADGTFLSNQEAVEVNGGDGFDCAISKVNLTPDGSMAWMATSQYGNLVRGITSPGSFNNYGSFYDENIAALQNDAGEVGTFYSVVQLYENTNDPDTQRKIILVNPYGETVTDSTFTLLTSNQNLPFEYTLPEGVSLPYYEMLTRPERLLDAPLSEDPDYFWLDAQVAIPQLECDTDSTLTGTQTVITSITPILDSIFVPQLNNYYVFQVGADTTYAEVDVYSYTETCDTMYLHPADTLYDVPGRLQVPDPYTTITAVGFAGSQGVWITRDGLNFNTTPEWIRLGNAPGSAGVKAIEFAVNVEPEAGNHMFVAGWDGKLYRFSGLEDIWSQEDVMGNMSQEILSAGAVVTGISVDPNDPNHVVVSIGGYGVVSGGKVQETFNALSANPTWSNIWFPSGEMAKMPCYDVVIDAMDASGETILVGTEYGVWATDNGGEEWHYTATNMGSPNGPTAPVFAMKQQWRGNSPWIAPSNQGAIYAATHGRGIFRSDLFLEVNEGEAAVNATLAPMQVYPNPASQGVVNVASSRMRGDIRLEIFDLSGRMLIQQNVARYDGQRLTVDVSGLPSGSYVIRLVGNRTHEAAQLQVRK